MYKYNTNIFEGLFFLQNGKQRFEGNEDPSKEKLYIQAYICQRLLQEMAEVLQ